MLGTISTAPPPPINPNNKPTIAPMMTAPMIVNVVVLYGIVCKK
jgi:hypothetical protein